LECADVTPLSFFCFSDLAAIKENPKQRNKRKRRYIAALQVHGGCAALLIPMPPRHLPNH
jgi:hypothetical protein